MFTAHKYSRYTEVNWKALDKGNLTEESSITTVSRITKTFLKKNSEHLKNKWIKGTPDLFIGDSINDADIIRDTKSSWNLFSFMRAKNAPLNPLYYWQMQSYMDLSNASVAFVDYCLNDTPFNLVERELKSAAYNNAEGFNSEEDELKIISNLVYTKEVFIEYCIKRGLSLDNSIAHQFIEIPLKERHFAIQVDRNQQDIERIHARVEEAREWVNKNLI